MTLYNKDNTEFETNIHIKPMPKNCGECPFFHCANPDEINTYDEFWTCYLGMIKNYNGIFVERAKDCPLVEGG